MYKIIVGTTELEVVDMSTFAYMQGKGEKVLRIKVNADAISFEDLRKLLEGNEEAIAYYEDDKLMCDYVGYGKFESTYADGIHNVELHKASVDAQLNALLNANEKMTKSQAALERANAILTANNEMLVEQNGVLNGTLMELMETVIPTMFSDLAKSVEVLQSKVQVLENAKVVEEPVTTEE